MKRRNEEFLRKLRTLFTLLAVFELSTFSSLMFFAHRYSTLSPYQKLVKMSPTEIECPDTDATIEFVQLLSEYVMVISEDEASYGVATFKVEDDIYIFGHENFKEIGGLVVKVNKDDYYGIDSSNLIAEVVEDTEMGVIAKQCKEDIREYANIPVAKNVQLGEAYMLLRDESGNLCKYAITIEAFKEDQGIFLYSSSEIQFCKGMSGTPIVQNGEIIGVHFASMEDHEVGVARIIWELEIVHPKYWWYSLMSDESSSLIFTKKIIIMSNRRIIILVYINS